MLINLFAGPCSGKTTTAHALYAALKVQNIKVELARETAFDMIISGRAHMLEDQIWMFAEQNRRIETLMKQGYHVITDCPLLLSIIYSKPSMVGYGNFVELIKSYHHSYNSLDFFLERPATFQEWGRVHTLEQSLEIDRQVKHLLKDVGVDFVSVQTNDQTVDTLSKDIIGCLNA